MLQEREYKWHRLPKLFDLRTSGGRCVSGGKMGNAKGLFTLSLSQRIATKYQIPAVSE
jgi:hypothetical protein